MEENKVNENQIQEKSPTITKLAAALSKAQSRIENALKDSTNPHFKSRYADLASVVAACKVALSSNGLSIVQIPFADGPKVSVKTVLMHDSGEYISGVLSMTAQQNTPQSIGSCITYARRYALASFTGVAPDDDDGNEATAKPTERQIEKQAERQPQKVTNADSQSPQKSEPVKVTNNADSLIKAFADLGYTVTDVEDYVGKSLKEFLDVDFSVAKEFYKKCQKRAGGTPNPQLAKLNQFTKGNKNG
jgi:hypothetical protein